MNNAGAVCAEADDIIAAAGIDGCVLAVIDDHIIEVGAVDDSIVILILNIERTAEESGERVTGAVDEADGLFNSINQANGAAVNPENDVIAVDRMTVD